MTKIKKLTMTLVALFAMTTGARADWTGETYTATANENLSAITVNADATLTINEGVTVTVTGGINVASGTLTVTGPGTLVVTGAKGNDGANGGDNGYDGGNGRVAISGNIIVQGGATVTATGGTGGKGGNGNDAGGKGGKGGVAISGNIIVQGGATVTATGGTGGNGGNGYYEGDNGGNGGNAFAGTLTYKSGTVTANGGSGGSGGTGTESNGSSGSAGKAFANDVDFTQTTGYSVTDGTSTIESVLGQIKVVISGGTEPEPPIEVTWNAATKTGTFTQPASDVVLTPIYAPVAQWATENEVALLPTAAEGIFAGTTDPIIVEGTVAPEQGTVMYAVTTDATTAPTLAAFSATVPTAENIADEGATVYVWYYIQGADTPDGQEATAENTFNDSEICATPLEVSVLSNQFDITFNAANANTIESGKATVTVGGTAATVTEGKLEAVKMGSEVKMTAKQGYKFRKVEAKKTGPTVWDGDLSKLTAESTAEFATATDGMTITGTLGANVNVQISIAEGATVTLDGVTINGVNNGSYQWAGITCLGDATIILSGTNTVKGFHRYYPGIHVPQNKTLTIQGSGSLTASSNGYACGIGGGYQIACGNIVIADGTITATGGQYVAGIGGGYNTSCGNISITGGTITATSAMSGAGIGSGGQGSCGNISITGGTVTANGGMYAAGIGSGYYGSCGTVTITNGVTSVTATKGSNAKHSIGAGGEGSCDTVTVGGAPGFISDSPYTYQPSN